MKYLKIEVPDVSALGEKIKQLESTPKYYNHPAVEVLQYIHRKARGGTEYYHQGPGFKLWAEVRHNSRDAEIVQKIAKKLPGLICFTEFERDDVYIIGTEKSDAFIRKLANECLSEEVYKKDQREQSYAKLTGKLMDLLVMGMTMTYTKSRFYFDMEFHEALDYACTQMKVDSKQYIACLCDHGDEFEMRLVRKKRTKLVNFLD
ncbi:hypothetical protein IQ260_24280 [Leptolyngbya cf. ectocarpi LEGE 11479]|uniref:Uncharacterized protein n=1 Tax=Leptolyngbya cf. ectocarpi LEGE 11479 TaxID=1828722 RepID=A0A928ZYH4_LEPEC|nr:hypothetical protein [Leptolyngbya ectocarpi]MBE9069765.1 hypothetical protein [Leptolyngbya cf. ectocarpi LEGE 11479]